MLNKLQINGMDTNRFATTILKTKDLNTSLINFIATGSSL